MRLSINLARHRYLNQRVLTLIALGVAALLILVLVLQVNIYSQHRARIDNLRAELSALQEQLQGRLPERISPAALAEQQQAYAAAEQLLQRDAFRWTALLNEMEQLLPDGVSLRNFRPDYTRKHVSLTGVARNLTTLRAFIDNLNSASFTAVYLTGQSLVSMTDLQGQEQQVLTFTLDIQGGF